MRSGGTAPRIFKTRYMTKASAQFHAPATLSRGKSPVTILDDVGLAPEPVWTPQKRTFRKSTRDSAVTPVTTATELPQFNRHN
jgi:hypothetical protein